MPGTVESRARAYRFYTSSYYSCVIDCAHERVSACVCAFEIRFKENISVFTRTFICEILSVCSRADRTDKNDDFECINKTKQTH